MDLRILKNKICHWAAKNNLGWESTGVVEMGGGVVDGGGNILRDPLFVEAMNRDYHVKDPEAAKYGVYAP